MEEEKSIFADAWKLLKSGYSLSVIDPQSEFKRIADEMCQYIEKPEPSKALSEFRAKMMVLVVNYIQDKGNIERVKP